MRFMKWVIVNGFTINSQIPTDAHLFFSVLEGNAVTATTFISSCSIPFCFCSMIFLEVSTPPRIGMFRSIRTSSNPFHHFFLFWTAILSSAFIPSSASWLGMLYLMQNCLMINLLMNWSSTIRTLGHPHGFLKIGFIWSCLILG